MRYIEAKIKLANPQIDFHKTNSNGEISIISPIPRSYTTNGVPIYETHNSCSYKAQGDNKQPVLIDYNQGGYSEIKLIKELEGIEYLLASDLADNYLNSNNLIKELNLNLEREIRTFALSNAQEISTKFNWDIKVIKKIKMMQLNNETFTIPIINNNVILSLATYNQNSQSTKWCYSKGTKGGLIFNYDNWIYDQSPTYLCEGAKDMLTLLSLGYNAISISNGASTVPKFYKNAFKDRIVYIIYDNDEAGKNGAKKVASWLFSIDVKRVKIIDLSSICKGKGEDIYDFFNKYHKTKIDLENIIKDTVYFTQTDYLNAILDKYPLLSIQEAKSSDKLKQKFQTDIIIKAVETDRDAIVPEKVEITYQWPETSNNQILTKSIEITDKQELFYYLKPAKIQRERLLNNIRGYAKNKKNFEILDIKRITEVYIFCYTAGTISNSYTSVDDKGISMSHLCYSIGKRLEINTRYRITYMLTSHPDNKSEPLVLILDAVIIEEIEPDFTLTKVQYASLKVFQQTNKETVSMAINRKFQEAQQYLGYDLDKQRNLWLTYELLYHSVFEYKWEDGTKKIGLLVCLVFGDWGFGKSHIYQGLSKLYEKGTFLTGNNVTDAGLVGGSTQRSNGERKVVSGFITPHHKGLIILEEFTSATDTILPKITDLITRGQLRITRVGEDLLIKVNARWLFIANTKSGKKLADYKHGMIPYKELVKLSQWDRRFDIVLGVSTDDIKNSNGKASRPSDKNYKEQLPYPQELYKLKVHWIWSRTSSQIIIPNEIQNHIFSLCEKWLEIYGERVEIVGNIPRIIYDKICRIAIACAGLLFSTLDGINLIITKEHANWAYQFLVDIYDNKIFNIKEFVSSINKYKVVTDVDKKVLQQIWEKDSNFLEALSEVETTIKNISDLKNLSTFPDDGRAWSHIQQQLVKYHFVKPGMYGLTITDKFFTAYKQIDKTHTSIVQEKEYDI